MTCQHGWNHAQGTQCPVCADAAFERLKHQYQFNGATFQHYGTNQIERQQEDMPLRNDQSPSTDPEEELRWAIQVLWKNGWTCTSPKGKTK